MRVAGASRSLVPELSASTQSSTDDPGSGQAGAPITSVTPTSNSPWRRPSAWNTSLVATGIRGLIMTQGSFGRLSGSRVAPTPVMTQAREARHTGTSAPVRFAASISRGSSSARPLVCASSRSAAAAAAGPAADTGRYRQHLVESEHAELQIRHEFAEQFGGLEHEVVGGIAAGA